MVNISGFSFIHNGLSSGYPFIEAIMAVQDVVDEVVVVDMQSTDRTRKVLKDLGCVVLDGTWEPGEAGACLAKNHALHIHCVSDYIIHFEGDEVWPRTLLQYAASRIQKGIYDLEVFRIQLEQNFQRVRWYPTRVHRVFPKGSVTKQGHTTNRAGQGQAAPPDIGYLWDFPVMLRDDWIPRMKKQAELWGHPPRFLLAGDHINNAKMELTEEEAMGYLRQPHWISIGTPFNIPDKVRHLVGRTCYG